MNDWFYLTLGGLAAYRLSLMVSKEDGPAYIFRKLRRMPDSKNAKDGMACQWCVSIWAGAVVTWYEWFIGLVPSSLTPIWWLSVSSIAVIANQTFTKGK